jgi:3-deoxy-D-manno-octulosonic-acid transferase
MRLIYVLGVKLYGAAVRIASLWNPKARKWLKGREESFKKLTAFQTRPSSLVARHPVYWFHCASLGEFEQGRPLIEALKAKEDCSVVITFFSPSGYEIRKNYELADLILYLPEDSKKNARNFLDAVKPDGIFFIKYEFWAAYIFEAQRRKIPLYSVSAVFRENQFFFKWYGGYMRKVLSAFTKIFVQDERSQKLLGSVKIPSVVSGDTRYDRVMANASKAKRFPLIDGFAAKARILVCGSVWADDLNVLSPPLNQLSAGWKIIIAPHEISDTYIRELESRFKSKTTVRYSQLSDQNQASEILIIDNIGMLMHLYGYGNMAYVGGAFKTGLHNILEPASFGLPVIFGPHHQKFPEAQLFIDNGIGFSVSNTGEFELTLKKLMNENHHEKVMRFMNLKKGATSVILSHIHRQNS